MRKAQTNDKLPPVLIQIRSKSMVLYLYGLCHFDLDRCPDPELGLMAVPLVLF